jgi:hypothetical protein
MAAFVFMVASLIAFVACEPVEGPPGAPGKAGETGDRGITGPAGKEGSRGQPGTGPTTGPPITLPLTRTYEGDPGFNADNAHIIAVNDVDGNVGTPGGPYTMHDLGFRGGEEPVEYEITGAITPVKAERVFDVKLDDDVLTVTVLKDTGDDDTVFAIEATDGSKATAERFFSVERNKRPVAFAEIHPLTTLIGTQDEDDVELRQPDRDPFTFNCDKMNSCMFAIPTLETGEPRATAWFVDANSGSLKYTAMSKDTSKATASISNDGKLVVTGVSSTWDAAADPAAHKAVDIEIMATDAGDLTAKMMVSVQVDGAPTYRGGLLSTYNVAAGEEDKVIVTGISGFFVDPEGEALTASVPLEASQTGSQYATFAISAGNLTVTGKNEGPATVKVKISEPDGDADNPGQYIEHEIRVNVGPAVGGQ